MWKPLAEAKLTDMIEDAELSMSPGCRSLWDNIKINPQKWTQSPWGDDGGGFWVVAVLGSTCIYYNDIEDGFNFSPYTIFGHIDEYHSNQTDLIPVIEHLCQQVTTIKRNA